VLVVRTDLGMTKGKVAAQCGHAVLACYRSALRKYPQSVSRWEHRGQAKVALKCGSEEEMLDLMEKARGAGLAAQSIQDAGRTQIAAGSRTVLAIGPGPISVVNQVTGHLKLY
ncbi:MAG: peptidyl-tRNA hydrolase, partial [Piptocephalis tieghemiana]